MRLLLIGLAVVACALCKPQVPLIVLGVDGYSYNLFNSLNLAETAIPLKPVFPSKTFPNFYSIATGLYPTQHGIISNRFINKKKGKQFSYEDDQGEGVVWYKGEPIWITATKQGLVAYTDMWVGSGAEIEGVRPDRFSYYNGSKTFEEKVEDLVTAFDSPTRPDLFVLYYNQPDYTFHRTDISNKTKVDSILLSVESKIALLKSSLGERSYNLIIVSDHGMTSYTNKVSLDKELKKKAFFSYYYGGPVAFWYTNKADNVSEIAKEINQKTPNVTASDVRELPKRWQLCGLEDEGLPEILINMEEGTVLDSSSQSSGHGYDNDMERMWSMLRVSGPAFKPLSPRTEPLKNTELYNLFCTLLRIDPAPNTGELDTFDFLLHTVPDRSNLAYTKRPPPCNEISGDIRAAPGIVLMLWLLCIM